MTVRVGINGFGRIGRNVFRAGFNRAGLEFVAVNDLPTPTATLAHLLKYDSILGQFDAEVSGVEDGLVVNGKTLKIFNSRSPAEIPWGDLGVEVVVESTGVFTAKEKARFNAASSRLTSAFEAPASWRTVINRRTWEVVIAEALCPPKKGRRCLRKRLSTSFMERLPLAR